MKITNVSISNGDDGRTVTYVIRGNAENDNDPCHIYWSNRNWSPFRIARRTKRSISLMLGIMRRDMAKSHPDKEIK